MELHKHTHRYTHRCTHRYTHYDAGWLERKAQIANPMRFQEFSIVCGFHLHSIWIWHSPIFIFFPSSYLLLLLLFACILLSFYVVVTATATSTTTTTIIDNNNSNNNTRMPRAYLCCHVACEVQLAAIPLPPILLPPSSFYSIAWQTTQK